MERAICTDCEMMCVYIVYGAQNSLENGRSEGDRSSNNFFGDDAAAWACTVLLTRTSTTCPPKTDLPVK